MAVGFNEVGIKAAWQLRGNGADAFRMIGPAAVNLALATELYLKTIHLLNARRPPGIHDLWKLFDALPALTIDLLEKGYGEALAVAKDELKSMHMRIVRGNEEEKPVFPPAPVTVKVLLERHNHAFTSWRYLHEFSSKGYDYHFDYHEMHVFCGVLNAHAADLLNARPPRFGVASTQTGEPV